MEKALGEADQVLAVLSPRYFASAYATDDLDCSKLSWRAGCGVV
jgi:hypothetical protein